MVDHPLYTMWKERRAAEQAAEAHRLKRMAARQEGEREWREAWETYQRHWAAGRASAPRQRWWHYLCAWFTPQTNRKSLVCTVAQ